jgi:hypothetical protein
MSALGNWHLSVLTLRINCASPHHGVSLVRSE